MACTNKIRGVNVEPHTNLASLYCFAIIKYSLNTDAGGLCVKVYWKIAATMYWAADPMSIVSRISCFSLRRQTRSTRQQKETFLGLFVVRTTNRIARIDNPLCSPLCCVFISILAHKFCRDSMSMWIAFKFVKQRTTKKYNPSGICTQ